jgi:hypothetical protein
VFGALNLSNKRSVDQAQFAVRVPKLVRQLGFVDRDRRRGAILSDGCGTAPTAKAHERSLIFRFSIKLIAITPSYIVKELYGRTYAHSGFNAHRHPERAQMPVTVAVGNVPPTIEQRERVNHDELFYRAQPAS